MFAPKFPVLAKVRAGRKNAKGHPEAVEWFVCDDDARFIGWAGEPQPNPLRIILPYDLPADCFTATRERWDSSSQTCYSQDGQVAFRKAGPDGWTPDFRARERTRVQCLQTQCPDAQPVNGKAPKCKPTGRLYFFVEGQDDLNGVFQLDTHGLESIQRIGAVMGIWAQGGLAGRGGTLSVAMKKASKGTYPIITLAIDGAPAAVISAPQGPSSPPQVARERLINALRHFGKDPKDPVVVEWVQRVGVDQALELLAARAKAERVPA